MAKILVSIGQTYVIRYTRAAAPVSMPVALAAAKQYVCGYAAHVLKPTCCTGSFGNFGQPFVEGWEAQGASSTNRVQ